MRIVIAGGGTAGHVFPALAVARELARRGDVDVRFVGTAHGLEARLVPEAGFSFTAVPARPFVRSVRPSALKAPFTLLRSLGKAKELVRDTDVVVGMGGYASGPVVLAAVQTRRALVLHEQNAVPGAANRVFSRFARVVALAFAAAATRMARKARTVVTGNPIRDEIARVPEDRNTLGKEGRRELDLDEDRRTVLIFGGSQGALHIDRATVDACRVLENRADLQVLLLTGRAHFDSVSRDLLQGSELLVRALPFLDRMELAYALADLVVCRAGATTVAEVTACGLPSILVPYPYATARHQEANARAVQRAGGASVLLDEELLGEVLAERIESLIDDEERLTAMSERSASFGRPDAAEKVAALVMEQAS